MALLGEKFAQEFAAVKADEGFTPVPAGEYLLKVTGAELKESAKGGMYIKVQFDILGPTYKGRKLFANFNYMNANPTAERIGRQQLRGLTTAGHVADPFLDTDQLLGITVKGNVTIRKPEGNYSASNEVKSYKAVDAADTIPASGGSFSGAFAAPTATAAPAPFKW